MNNISLKPLWGVIFWCFSLHTAEAQNLLNLDEALKMALEQNHAITISKNREAISQNNATMGNAGLLPSIGVNGGYQYSLSNTKAEYFGSIPPVDVTGAGSNTYNASATLRYTLFDGLAVFYNYDKLKEIAVLSEVQSRQNIENTLVQVISAYYNVAAFQEDLAIAREALNISKVRIERTENQVKYGQATGLNLLNTQVNYNADSTLVINTKLQLVNAIRNLQFLLGDANTGDTLIVSNELSLQNNLIYDDLWQKAQSNNAAVRLAQYNGNTANLDLKIAQAARFPQVLGTVSYSYNNQINDAGFLLSNQNNGLSAGVSVNFNLFNGGQTNTRIKNAQINAENIALSLDQIQQQVAVELQNAYNRYTTNKQLLQLQEENLQFAQSNFDRSKQLADLGQITNLDFREAQLNLIRAKNAISDAKYQSKISEFELLRIAGILLE